MGINLIDRDTAEVSGSILDGVIIAARKHDLPFRTADVKCNHNGACTAMMLIKGSLVAHWSVSKKMLTEDGYAIAKEEAVAIADFIEKALGDHEDTSFLKE